MDKTNFEYFIEDLNSCIGPNYNKIKDIFNFKYGYPEFDPLRDEICKCIICNLNQAAITLTNHLLESSLKKCLAMKHSVSNKHKNIKLEESYKEGITKFDKRNLNENINTACTQGLITIEQKNLFLKFKNEFRNAYSHASTSDIFKNKSVKGKAVSLKEGESTENLLKRIFDNKSDKDLIIKDILPIQGLMQVAIAEQISIQYFTEVDKVLREILKKIKLNNL